MSQRDPYSINLEVRILVPDVIREPLPGNMDLLMEKSLIVSVHKLKTAVRKSEYPIWLLPRE